jgi:hypothetical protein
MTRDEALRRHGPAGEVRDPQTMDTHLEMADERTLETTDDNTEVQTMTKFPYDSHLQRLIDAGLGKDLSGPGVGNAPNVLPPPTICVFEGNGCPMARGHMNRLECRATSCSQPLITPAPVGPQAPGSDGRAFTGSPAGMPTMIRSQIVRPRVDLTLTAAERAILAGDPAARR